MSEKRKRLCPLCGSNEKREICNMELKQFVDLNHTLKKDVIEKYNFKRFDNIPLVECKKCEFIYVEYVLNHENLSIWYNQVIDHKLSKQKIYNHEKRYNYIQIWSDLYKYALSKNFKSSEKIVVLEYGCGWGDFLSMANSEGVDCFGIEFDQRKIKYCKEKGLRILKNIDEIPNKNTINIFFTNQLFEHIDNFREIFEEVKKYLKNEFIGYFSVPQYCSNKIEKIKTSLENNVPFDKSFNYIEHLNYFTPKTSFDLMDSLDFEIFDIQSNKKIKNNSTTNFYYRFKTQ